MWYHGVFSFVDCTELLPLIFWLMYVYGVHLLFVVCKLWRDLLHELWLSTKHMRFDKSFSIFRSKQGYFIP